MASIANYFNPSGTATDDIMQLKALADSNNGDLDSVINDQLISKYGSLEKLYEVYQSEQNNTFTNEADALAFYNKQNPNQSALTPIEETDIGQAMGQRMEGIPRTRVINPHQMGLQENYSNMPVINPEPPSALPNEDNLYDENIARLIAQNQGQSEADILASQPDFRGQLQAMVDQSGSGGTVEYASHKTDDDREDKSLVDSILGIVKMPWEAAKGLYDITGEATHGVIDTFSDPAKFKSKLQDPRVQAGLRTVYEMGTPSFSSPFAKVSKALLDTSTYLSAADEAKAEKKGTNKTTDMLFIPGQNPTIDLLLKTMQHSDTKGTMYDFLVSESMKNNYFKIGMITNNGQFVGLDGVLKPNTESYTDETFENYKIGTNPTLDKLIKKSGLSTKINDSTTNKITVTMGPQDKLFAIENIETDGVTYAAGEFYETFNPNDELGKKIEARYPGQFKKGESIKVEAFRGELNGEIQWGDLISVVEAYSPKTKSKLESLENMPRSKNASDEVVKFYDQLDSSRKQATSLNSATGALMTLDSPEKTLGKLQNFFTPFANIIDRLMGGTAAGDYIIEALVGSPDAFKAREEASAYLNRAVIPKLKDFYPVSDKDVAFIQQTLANLGTKSYFKLASFYNGIYGFDERMELGLREFYKLIDKQGYTGYDFTPDGVEFDGKNYNSAMRFARAWANKNIEEEWDTLKKDEKIIAAAKEMRGIKDLDTKDIGNVTKLAIINYANQKDKMTVDTEKLKENNKSELTQIFFSGDQDRAKELSMKIMDRRFAINNLWNTYKEKGVLQEDWALDQITQQIESFEDTYGLDYGTIGSEAWLGVDKTKDDTGFNQNFYLYVLNELRA